MDNIIELIRRVEDRDFVSFGEDLKHSQEWRDLKDALNQLNSYLPEEEQMEII